MTAQSPNTTLGVCDCRVRIRTNAALRQTQPIPARYWQYWSTLCCPPAQVRIGNTYLRRASCLNSDRETITPSRATDATYENLATTAAVMAAVSTSPAIENRILRRTVDTLRHESTHITEANAIERRCTSAAWGGIRTHQPCQHANLDLARALGILDCNWIRHGSTASDATGFNSGLSLWFRLHPSTWADSLRLLISDEQRFRKPGHALTEPSQI